MCSTKALDSVFIIVNLFKLRSNFKLQKQIFASHEWRNTEADSTKNYHFSFVDYAKLSVENSEQV